MTTAKHEYQGPVKVAYRLQPMWYDHIFTGLPYEAEKLIEAIRAVGGKVYRVYYKPEEAKRGCGCNCHSFEPEIDVTAEYCETNSSERKD